MTGSVVKLGEYSYIWNLLITDNLYYKSPEFKLKIISEFNCYFDLYFSQNMLLRNLQLRMFVKPYNLSLKEKDSVYFEAFILNNNMEKIHGLHIIETYPCYTDNVEYNSSSKKKLDENVFNADKDNILDDTKLMILLVVKENRLVFENSSFQNNALEDFKSLFMNDEFSDTTLIVDNKVFKVHKAILSFRSFTFSRMLTDNNEQNHEICITNVTSEIMQEVLRFIYTGKVENGEALAKDLLIAASKFHMGDLEELAERYLCNGLKVDNVIDTLRCVDENRSKNLVEQAIYFLVSNYEEWHEKSNSESLADLSGNVLTEAFLQACSR